MHDWMARLSSATAAYARFIEERFAPGLAYLVAQPAEPAKVPNGGKQLSINRQPVAPAKPGTATHWICCPVTMKPIVPRGTCDFARRCARDVPRSVSAGPIKSDGTGGTGRAVLRQLWEPPSEPAVSCEAHRARRLVRKMKQEGY
jgi:hypothetical protein